MDGVRDGCSKTHGSLVPTFIETRALNLRIEEGRLASKASHAGIIRIGFEGIFSAPPRGAPLFQYI